MLEKILIEKKKIKTASYEGPCRRLPRYLIGRNWGLGKGLDWDCKGAKSCENPLCIVEPPQRLPKSRLCNGLETGRVLEIMEKGDKILQALRSNNRSVGEKKLGEVIEKLEEVDLELCALIMRQAGSNYAFSGNLRDATLAFSHASRLHTDILKTMCASPILFGGKMDWIYKEHVRRNSAGAAQSLAHAFDYGAQVIENRGAIEGGNDAIKEEQRLFALQVLKTLRNFSITAEKYRLDARAGIPNDSYLILSNCISKEDYEKAFQRA